MKKTFEIPAFVLGMSVNGLGVVRSLGREGVNVFAFDVNADCAGMATGYATCMACPDVQKNPEGFKQFLFQAAKDNGGRAVLFATSDNFNEFVNNFREQLAPVFIFTMPAKPLMDQLLNKKGQYELAVKHGVPVPKTYFPANINDVNSVALKLGYPVILKGLRTGNWRQKFGDKKAVVVKNAEELLENYRRISDEGHIEAIIQEIIPGEDTAHYKICAYFNREAKPLLTFTLQKIRQYPCDFGIGSTVISKWEPKVAELGLNFMKVIGYRGVGSIEFKKDARNGEFKMIEINPRLWAQNSLSDACGQNFPFATYLDILGVAVAPKTQFIENIKWIAFPEDRASFKGYFRQGRITIASWLLSILTGKKVWAVWSLDDPMPFLKSIKFGLLPFEKIFSRLWGKKNPNAMAGDAKETHIEIIENFDLFLKLRQEWNALLEKTGINNPFLRHEWLSSWWAGYGKDKKLLIVRFIMAGKTVGFAPLMSYRTRWVGCPVEAIGFISNHWTRMDFLILPEVREACLDGLAHLFAETGKIIILAQMDPQSENYSSLRQGLSNRGVKFAEVPKMHSYIPVTGSWEDYLKNQSRNFRQTFRKKLRHLEKQGAVELLRFESGTNGRVADQLKQIAQNSWQAKENANVITTSEGEVFYSSIIKEWADKNLLDFTILQVNKKPISYMVGVKEKDCYFAFDTAFDKNFDAYSPGVLLHNLLLEKLFQNGVKRFDFGYTAEYKKHWTEKENYMRDLIIVPSTMLGTIFLGFHKLKTQLKGKGL